MVNQTSTKARLAPCIVYSGEQKLAMFVLCVQYAIIYSIGYGIDNGIDFAIN